MINYQTMKNILYLSIIFISVTCSGIAAHVIPQLDSEKQFLQLPIGSSTTNVIKYTFYSYYTGQHANEVNHSAHLVWSVDGGNIIQSTDSVIFPENQQGMPAVAEAQISFYTTGIHTINLTVESIIGDTCNHSGAQAVYPVTVYSLSINGPTEVKRGQVGNYSANCSGVTPINYRWTSDKTTVTGTSTNWSGYLVIDSTKVNLEVDVINPYSLSTISVFRGNHYTRIFSRPWDAPIEQKRDYIYKCCPSYASFQGGKENDIAYATPSTTGSFSTLPIDNGPNTGYIFVSSVSPDAKWDFIYSHNTVMDINSEFSCNQGDSGELTAAELSAACEKHELNGSDGNHYSQFGEAESMCPDILEIIEPEITKELSDPDFVKYIVAILNSGRAAVNTLWSNRKMFPEPTNYFGNKTIDFSPYNPANKECPTCP